MQPGEAYNLVCAVLTYLSRQSSTDPGLLSVIWRGQEGCKVLGDRLGLQPPTPDDLVPYLAHLGDTKEAARPAYHIPVPASAPAPATASKSSYAKDVGSAEAKPTKTLGEVREALGLLDSMIKDFDEAPSAAEEYVEGIKPTVLDMKDRISQYNKCSEKQMNYIQNMRRGLDKWMHKGSGRREDRYRFEEPDSPY